MGRKGCKAASWTPSATSRQPLESRSAGSGGLMLRVMEEAESEIFGARVRRWSMCGWDGVP